MTSLALHVARAARSRRGLSRVVAAVANAFETIVEVFAEAENRSAAARERFPLAD